MLVVFNRSVAGRGWNARKGEIVEFADESVALELIEVGYVDPVDVEEEEIPEPEPVVETPKPKAKSKKSKKSE